MRRVMVVQVPALRRRYGADGDQRMRLLGSEAQPPLLEYAAVGHDLYKIIHEVAENLRARLRISSAFAGGLHAGADPGHATPRTIYNHNFVYET